MPAPPPLSLDSNSRAGESTREAQLFRWVGESQMGWPQLPGQDAAASSAAGSAQPLPGPVQAGQGEVQGPRGTAGEHNPQPVLPVVVGTSTPTPKAMPVRNQLAAQSSTSSGVPSDPGAHPLQTFEDLRKANPSIDTLLLADTLSNELCQILAEERMAIDVQKRFDKEADELNWQMGTVESRREVRTRYRSPAAPHDANPSAAQGRRISQSSCSA